MDDFIGELLRRIDASGRNFSERAFEVLARDVEPLLRVLFILMVLHYGVQLFLGTARVSIAELISRMTRALAILILISSWGNYDSLVYHWLTTVPEAAGRAILAASGTGVSEPTNGLSQIWKTANVAAATFSEQAGYLSVLPALVGAVVVVFAGLFVAVTLGVLVLAKVVLWVLLGTAPVFIACMLFNATRSYGLGWLNQSLLYALIPLFVYTIAAFLIAAMEPELTQINRISGNRELKLSDFAAFILLCLAGSFVLVQVQSFAQGIVGGLAMPIGHQARRTTGTALLWSREAISHSARRTRTVTAGAQERLRAASAGIGRSMQRVIVSSATPR